MQAIISGDREAFLAREIRQRQAGLLPPFGRLAALVISARDKELAQLFARDVARRAPPADRIEVLGPAEAPLAVIRGRHRWRLLVKAPRELDVQAYLRAWLGRPAEGAGRPAPQRRHRSVQFSLTLLIFRASWRRQSLV